MDDIKIQIFGDLSLNGTFCDPQYYENLRQSLNALDKQIGSSDLRVVNWESPITKEFNFNPLKNPAIATSITSANFLLKNFKIDLACLGNNHIGDVGTEGLETTITTLERNNVSHYGAKLNQGEINKEYVVTLKNKTFCFLSYVGPETNPKIEEGHQVFINNLEQDLVLKKISSLVSTYDAVLLTLHWGIEYNKYPNLQQREFAQKCINAGVKVIIGHHSHTLQGVEKYNNGLIFYSLGNFLFAGLKGRESFGWPSICNYGGTFTINFDSDLTPTFQFTPFTVSNEGIKLERDKKNNHLKKRLNKISNKFNQNNQTYKFNYSLNLLNVWGLQLPLFFIKVKGGIFGALRQYANFKYLKLVFGYLK